MIITFKSAVSGDLIMFGDVAKRLLSIIGKSDTPPGICTAEQLPAAIAALRAAVQTDRDAHGSTVKQQFDDQDVAASVSAVSLTQRAVPLIEMMELAHSRGKPVIWQ